MKLIVFTDGIFEAARLKDSIINSIKGEEGCECIDTWSYVLAANNHDVIFHNLSKYTDYPDKNVLFRMDLDGENIVFKPTWWKKYEQPSDEMKNLHTGKLVEMLLTHFSGKFGKISIQE